jgi:D-glycero-D-manno-heptose 1,7-bisphosphate phosphatase
VAAPARKRFVILDRDGTLIVERNYLADPAGVELLPGAAAGLRLLREAGLGLVVVTNQSGVGRGLFSEQTLGRIHDRLRELLTSESVTLDGVFYCPHTPDDACGCRKPKAELVERAAREFGFEPHDSFVIGDNVVDVELGRTIGATTILVETGYGRTVARNGTARPDFVVADLKAAAGLIAARVRSGAP